jgi:hypothetical protein
MKPETTPRLFVARDSWLVHPPHKACSRLCVALRRSRVGRRAKDGWLVKGFDKIRGCIKVIIQNKVYFIQRFIRY